MTSPCETRQTHPPLFTPSVMSGGSGNRSPHPSWPIGPCRQRVPWYPGRQRLTSLLRNSTDNSILPPALVRKAAWRD